MTRNPKIYLTLLQVDILKHSIQYIQKLRSLVESHHHHQTSSSGDSLRHLVEAHHQNLVEQTQLETSTSPHPFSHQEHQSPDGRYHPSTDSQYSPSSSSNNSSYPHLQQAEGGGRTNGHHYPHHGSPTSPPLMPSPDRYVTTNLIIIKRIFTILSLLQL